MADVVEDLQRATQADAGGDSSGPDQGQGESQDFGELFEDLPEDRVSELRSILQACNGKRDQWARMVEVIRCTLRRYFWLGIQHGFWNADSQQLQIGPNGGSVENLNEEDLFAGDFNIYTQNGKIFIAVFSQNAASTVMEPDQPGEPDSVKAAAEAEKYVRVYQKYNPPKVAQQEVGRLLWTDGRVIAVTKTDEHPDITTTEEDEEGNPVPFETELTTYHGVLETKCPLIEPFSQWPYCKVMRDIDILTAKHDNPKFADKLQTSAKGLTPNDEIARMSRIATAENIAQVSSDTLAYLVTEDTWWLRPSAFYELTEDRRAFWIGGKSKYESGAETATKGVFPNGCRVKFFGSVYCGAEAVAMSDELRIMHALPGKGNARPSLSDPMVPVQMEFNDAVGMYSEMIHKCIPAIWLNKTAEEIAAILEQFSRYGEYHPFGDAPAGQALGDNFFAEPTPSMPLGFSEWVENLQGPLSQFVTGNSPALFGAQMEDQKTAHGYAQARDQSLGLMALVWVPYLEFAASIRGQAARCAAKRATSKISAVVPDAKGGQQTLDVDVEALKGGFLSSAVTDQNFPESWTETSNTWKGMLAAAPANPLIAQQLQQPDNLSALKDAIGLKNFVIVGTDSRDLQLSEWAQMQGNGGPVPDEQATQQRDQQKQQAAQAAISQLAPPMPGQPPPLPPPLPPEEPILTSSVPIDIDTDDHVVHALEMFRVLNSPEGQQIKHTSEPVWQDGKLHMLAHVAAAKAKGLLIPPPLGGAPAPMMPPPGAHPPIPGAPGLPGPGPLAPPPGAPSLTGAPNALPSI